MRVQSDETLSRVMENTPRLLVCAYLHVRFYDRNQKLLNFHYEGRMKRRRIGKDRLSLVRLFKSFSKDATKSSYIRKNVLEECNSTKFAGISFRVNAPIHLLCHATSRSGSIDRVNTVQLLPRKLTSNASATSSPPLRWISLLGTTIKAPRALHYRRCRP